jgi:uncharacterized membrane protein YhaH (DUF805 family)
MTNATAATASSESVMFPQRIGRVSFLVRYVIFLVVALPECWMTTAAGLGQMVLLALAGLIVLAALIYYFVHFILIARVRDTGLHAAFTLLMLVPLVGALIFLALFFIPAGTFRKADAKA